jgi:Tfp pilus assembly protein PilF
MTAEPQRSSVATADFPGDLGASLLRGEITLAQVFGLDKPALYEIARAGYDLLTSGKLREAKQIYAGLVAADPYDSVFHCHLAAVHHRLGEFDAAFAQYEQSLKFNVSNCDALVGHGEILLSRGQLALGFSDLKRAITIDREGKRLSTARARALLLALHQSGEDQ